MSNVPTFVSSLVPSVNLPDLGRITLPDGSRLDLRFFDNTAEFAITGTAEVVVQVFLVLIILTAGWLLSNKVASLTQRALIRAKLEVTFAAFIGSMARYALFFTAVLAAFKILGVSLFSTVAVFGALGLAIAFALRNTLSHVAAGIMLIANRPFKVGDYITMDNHEGTVKRITLFNTEVNTLSNQRVYMPNARIWENVLINHTYNDVRMIEYKLPIVGNATLDKLRSTLVPLLQAHSKILKKPEPLIGFDSFDQGNLIAVIRVWVKLKDYAELRYSLLDGMIASLQAAKLGPLAPLVRNVTEQTTPQPRKKA